MNDTVETESGELTESFSESENLLQNQGLLKKRSKLYGIRYRRIAPYWLRNVNIDEGWNDEEDNGDDDEEEDDDDEEEENDEDEELEAAMLSYDERNLVQLPVDEDLEESMLAVSYTHLTLPTKA